MTQIFKKGDIVKFHTPYADEVGRLFEIYEDNETRCYATEYIGRDKIGLVENALTLIQYTDIELATATDIQNKINENI